MSEPRRRRGRGIDAIFDTADLDLGPATAPRPRTEADPEAESPPDRGPSPEAGAQGLTLDGTQERKRGGEGTGDPLSEERRPRGRPRSPRSPDRELVQRGFYVEPAQDRMLDETKAALKTRGFTPDRSAIVRAALVHFARLDRFEQEQLVRRAK